MFVTIGVSVGRADASGEMSGRDAVLFLALSVSDGIVVGAVEATGVASGEAEDAVVVFDEL